MIVTVVGSQLLSQAKRNPPLALLLQIAAACRDRASWQHQLSNCWQSSSSCLLHSTSWMPQRQLPLPNREPQHAAAAA